MSTRLPAENVLLTRDQFRELALVRDRGRCVACGAPASEVHHIIERRLFSQPGEEGGYFLANAASVCNPCHVRAERTELAPAELRRAAGITKLVVPQSLYDDGIEADTALTKWGDLVLADGHRSPGPLFWDESVQKILRQAGKIGLYTTRVRYPRTFHVPFSPGLGKDDRVLPDMSSFVGQRVIVTRKYDGENCTVYPDGYLHARSPDGRPHPSQSRLRAWAAANAWQLPAGWRLSIESLQAVHAISYRALPAWFLLLGVWDERNVLLSFDQTIEWAGLLELRQPEVLYDGRFDEAVLRRLHRERDERGDEAEGWVMRLAGPIAHGDWSRSVAKWVRAGHVAAHARHWRSGPIEENRVITSR
jgi:hypothetical protein